MSAAVSDRRVCVYTSIYGGYDDLKQPAALSTPGCDFICFTDATWPRRVGAWRIVRSSLLPKLHPRMGIKYAKCMSHEVFPSGRLAWRFAPFESRPRYAYLIWVDGSIEVKSSEFVRAFVEHIGTSGLSMFLHPDPDCIYDELGVSIGMEKYAGLPLREAGGVLSQRGLSQTRGFDGGGPDSPQS